MTSEDNLLKDKTGLYFSVFAILLLILFLLLGLYVIRERTLIFPKAEETLNVATSSYNNVSFENSFAFASPVRAMAGGDLIRVNIFILDENGNGIVGKKVALNKTDINLTVSEVQRITDETGKAILDFGSNISQTYDLEFTADNNVIPQKIKIVFD